MNRTKLVTAGVLVVGLAAALTIHYWPEQEEGTIEAVPSPTATAELNPATPSEEPSPTNPASRDASASPSPSASSSAAAQQPGARQPAARQPGQRPPGPRQQRPPQRRAPRVNTPPRPTAVAEPPAQRSTDTGSQTGGDTNTTKRETSTTRAPSTTKPATSRAAKPADVAGLTITRNSHEKIVFKWKAVSGADAYEVFYDDTMIGRVEDTIANIRWETPKISIGVAAVKDGVRGEITRVEAERPPLNTGNPEPSASDEGPTPTPADPVPEASEPSGSPSESPSGDTSTAGENSEGA